MFNRYTAIAALAAMTALAACVPEGEDMTDINAVCRPDGAEKLVGISALTDDQIKTLTGASEVRRAVEGQGVTMDYRPYRVTVMTSPDGTQILRAMCG